MELSMKFSMDQDFLSLAIFTILAQCAAGMAFIKAFLPKGNDRKCFNLWALVAIVLLGLGACVSILHLNSPFNSYNALKNPLTSWLSNEIYSLIIFGICLVVCFFYNILYTRILAALSGILLVFCMSMVYMETNVSSWQGYTTMINFASSALVMGGACIFTLDIKTNTSKIDCFEYVPTILAVSVIIRIVATGVLVAKADLPINIMYLDLHITLVLLSLLVVMLMQRKLIFHFAAMTGRKIYNLPIYTTIMLVFIFVGELAGRMMFFRLYMSSGL